ncbi:hypothetical protein GCM10010401_07420 [Rarobacter faecitabidus]|uniref:hypothetical protein n=1 Tax=Rarobacter faecitabidus TaxID=13243 RepID=UPI0031D224F4
MTETPAETPEFDFDAWIDGATVTQVSVEILQRPDLLARYEDWERRYKVAEQAAGIYERSADEPDPLKALSSEGEALIEQMRASKATFYVRALDSRDVEAINDAHPLPEKPALFDKDMPLVGKNPTEAQAKAYVLGVKAWEQARDKFNAEHKEEHEAWAKKVAKAVEDRGAETLARAIASIEVGGRKVADGLDVDRVRKLGEQIGTVQLKRLVDAVDEATEAEPEVPAGFLSRTSESDLD